MKKGAWQAVLAGLLAAAIAVEFVWRLAGRGLSGPPPPSVLMHGPDLDSVERLEVKRRLTGEVIAGRLSLFQAAAAFRAADAQGGGLPTLFLLDVFPGHSSEEEAYCRSVIAWVGAEAPRDRAGQLTGRLQAELDARLRDGAIQLPDPGAR